MLRHVGGFDIVSMTASMVRCAELGVPFVLDGFISCVAYLSASLINPSVYQYAIPSHLSKEPGALIALQMGGISKEQVPIHAKLCLGEGTGAILMVGILKTMKYTFDNAKTLPELLGD